MSETTQNFVFKKTNYIILAVGILIIITGFLLMSGAGSTETYFNPDIYSARRIKVAPVVCLIGFLTVMASIIYRPKKSKK